MKTLSFFAATMAITIPTGYGIMMPAQEPGTLPVYSVSDVRISDAQVRRLADALKVPAGRIVLRHGAVSFLDPERYLAIPERPLDDAQARDRLLASSRGVSADSEVRLRALDVAAIRNLTTLDPERATSLAREAFEAAGLRVDSAKPIIRHTNFTATYTGANGERINVNKEIDTQVTFEFVEAGGHPLIGPGAEAEAAFDAAGNLIHLRYAGRQLKPGRQVHILSESEARERIARIVPNARQINLKLVYWAPPFEPAPGSREPVSPTTILPWYSFSTVTDWVDPGTGRATPVHSKIQLIPATDDSRFVPTARLRAAFVDGRVEAKVEATGGRAPYTYVWAGSNTTATESTGPRTSYLPIVRVPPTVGNPPSQRTFAAHETVSVTVFDANGISLQLHETIPVQAHPGPIEDHPGPGKGKGLPPTYGTESPREPTFAVDRVGWQQGMSSPRAGGGSQKYAWLGNLAWPGDFVEPSPKGSLPSTPWVFGDADYANWGVNTATIVLNNTDGWADGFASSQPGAVIADYAEATFSAPPTPGVTVQDNLLNYNSTATTNSYSINYSKAWGPEGPNDYLLWLIMDACDTLDAVDGNGLTPDQRWGAAFDGLHILLGWDSEEQLGTGSFEQDFAEDMLGVSSSPQQILQAWFSAAVTAGTGHGVAAALGPIGPGGVTNKADYFVGKGPGSGSIGPTILPADINGWWYIHQ